MNHRVEFKLLVLDKLGATAADAINWSAPRVVCIAADLTKYHGHAVQQIGRNIELIRYRRFWGRLAAAEVGQRWQRYGQQIQHRRIPAFKTPQLAPAAAQQVLQI